MRVNRSASTATRNSTFVDRGKLGDDGQPITTKLTASAGNATTNQVVFGAESGESIKGGTRTDRILRRWR